MYLELAENNNLPILINVPLPSGMVARVKETFFDNISDYEYSRLLEDISASPLNKNISVSDLINNRAERRGSFTYMQPVLESKFGNWLQETGKKIETFFKPDPKKDSAPVPLIQPDGSIVNVPAQGSKESGFTTLVRSVGESLGIISRPVNVPYVQPENNTMKNVALIGGGLLAALLVTKLVKK